MSASTKLFLSGVPLTILDRRIFKLASPARRHGPGIGVTVRFFFRDSSETAARAEVLGLADTAALPAADRSSFGGTT